MPEVAAPWATQEVHRNCCIFHSLLQKTQTSLMFLSSPKTFRVQIRKCTELPKDFNVEENLIFVTDREYFIKDEDSVYENNTITIVNE